MDSKITQWRTLVLFTLSDIEFSQHSFPGEQSDPLVMDFSSVKDDKPKEQLQRSLPKASQPDCSDECAHTTEVEEVRSSTPEIPAVSAFFSLAALAEVAAMENVHRSVVGHGWWRLCKNHTNLSDTTFGIFLKVLVFRLCSGLLFIWDVIKVQMLINSVGKFKGVGQLRLVFLIFLNILS